MAGTPTPYYGFPIPSDNDPADAPNGSVICSGTVLVGG